jgi:hypothetical protein
MHLSHDETADVFDLERVFFAVVPDAFMAPDAAPAPLDPAAGDPDESIADIPVVPSGDRWSF